MSFDLKIVGNDLAMNRDGSVQTVRDNEKLKQDILKAILTARGSNKFHQWYGSTVSERTIGRLLEDGQLEAEASSAIQETLSTIMALQTAQARIQYVSPGETLAAVTDIRVTRDSTDPRQWSITVEALTRQLTPVEETFLLKI
jgi:phage baseplate assembly protein W